MLLVKDMIILRRGEYQNGEENKDNYSVNDNTAKYDGGVANRSQMKESWYTRAT